jgi:hypothetical protein
MLTAILRLSQKKNKKILKFFNSFTFYFLFFKIYFSCLARSMPCRRHQQLGCGLAKLRNLFIFSFIYLKSFSFKSSKASSQSVGTNGLDASPPNLKIK